MFKLKWSTLKNASPLPMCLNVYLIEHQILERTLFLVVMVFRSLPMILLELCDYYDDVTNVMTCSVQRGPGDRADEWQRATSECK